MPVINEKSLKRWGNAWIGLTIALALHVADEALTGFLPLYNEIVLSARESIPWLPFPTFTFVEWIGGLSISIVVLLALSPLVYGGHTWLRPVSYFLGVMMIVNAFGHTAASIFWGTWAPGVYSSPVLFLAAVVLLWATRRTHSPAGGGVNNA